MVFIGPCCACAVCREPTQEKLPSLTDTVSTLIVPVFMVYAVYYVIPNYH